MKNDEDINSDLQSEIILTSILMLLKKLTIDKISLVRDAW